MTENDDKGRREKKVHGSNRRQRSAGAMVRMTPAESAALQTRARNAGLSVGAYLRTCALGESGPRAKRAPPLNRELMADALASLNRVGNNLNQIAKHLNSGGHPNHAAILDARAELVACLQVLMSALGHVE